MSRTNDSWSIESNYLIPNDRNPNIEGVAITGNDQYLNFNDTLGTAGYGFRDNSGTMEVKSSGGSWEEIIGADTIESIYLRLDGANSPMTGDLLMDTNSIFYGDGRIYQATVSKIQIESPSSQIGFSSILSTFNLRLLARSTTGLDSSLEYGEGTASTYYIRAKGSTDESLLASGFFTGRQTLAIDTSNRDRDHRIPIMDNTLFGIFSIDNPTTDNSRCITMTYLGIRAGSVDNADWSSSSFSRETDIATDDFTIGAASAWTSATVNQDGGDFIIFGGSAASGGGTYGSVKLEGSYKTDITEVTASTYTVKTNDYYISYQYTDTGTATATMPEINRKMHGMEITIKDADGNAGTNNITISPSGSDTIENDAAGAAINGDNISLTLKANFTTNNWEIK